MPNNANDADILGCFEGIEIFKVLRSSKVPNIADLEFTSKEEFIKAACLQGGKVKGTEFFVRFSKLIRRAKPAAE